jgi:outer membrane protein assembly factor BamB
MLCNCELVYEKIFKGVLGYYFWGIRIMKPVWWKLSILMMFVIICSPSADSFVFETIGKFSVDHRVLLIHDYMTDWYVNNSKSFQDTVTSIPYFQQERMTIAESNNVHADHSREGPMDSAWPMFSHDVIHTGRSPYSTKNNSGVEIWHVQSDGPGAVESSAVIDNNGIIYFGTQGSTMSLYALYPNGTRKWRFVANGPIWVTPALANNGDMYCTTWGGLSYLQAITQDGTERWRFDQESSSASAPTIGSDGTIYFGTDGHNIFAVNPDGTEKWRYTTSYIVMGSPAIDQDDIVYIGSGDHYLYALNPNGTLRWRFETGGEIKGSASIASDGTIYIPSFDGYLYALYSNGTMKWRVPTGGSIAAAGTAFAEDGTIYVGTEQLRAYYPDGTLKWTTNVQGFIYGTVPAISADGTIYVSAGGSLVAVNPDGSEKWRKQLTTAQIRSSPSIGPDDRVYVGSEDPGMTPRGYLHAFGLGPLYAEAYGPYNGAVSESIQFIGDAFGGTPPYQYYWDFGDGNTSEEQNPTHSYADVGTYMAIFTVTDSEGNTSEDTAQVTITAPAPTVTIVKPVNGIYIGDSRILPFFRPFIIGQITIQVDASQEPYGIDYVEFYIDGEIRATVTEIPYQWTWNTRTFFKHTINVIAYDTTGKSTEKSIDVSKFF